MACALRSGLSAGSRARRHQSNGPPDRRRDGGTPGDDAEGRPRGRTHCATRQGCLGPLSRLFGFEERFSGLWGEGAGHGQPLCPLILAHRIGGLGAVDTVNGPIIKTELLQALLHLAYGGLIVLCPDQGRPPQDERHHDGDAFAKLHGHVLLSYDGLATMAASQRTPGEAV
jgi:hypothetical protein